MESAKKLVVVLGMHRSGTSAVARGLQVMGISLGNRLMPAAEGDNPTGFWEDLDVYDLNNEMLAHLHRDWQFVSPLQEHELQQLRRGGFFLRAVDLIRSKLEGEQVFGLKDPRIAKLMPFWARVFEHCGLDVSYVLVVRNPLSVARSLQQRNGIDPGTGYLLWLSYVIGSLRGTRGERRIVVDYDRLMREPGHELSRISAALGMAVDGSRLREYCEAFLDPSLRHSSHALEDLDQDPACPVPVSDVYTALLAASRDEESPDEAGFDARLERWQSVIQANPAVLALVDRLGLGVRKREESLGELTNECAALRQTLTERDRNIESLTSKCAEHDRLKASLRAAEQRLSDRERTLAEIKNSRSWRMTAPYRAAGAALNRRFGRPLGSHLLTRGVTALLLLPAAVVLHEGLRAALAAARQEPDFFSRILGSPEVIRERLLYRNRWYRRFVFAGFSLALRIHRGGSIFRTLGNVVRIVRTEGAAGLKSRLIGTVPGMELPAVDEPAMLFTEPAMPSVEPDAARRILVADYRIPRPDVSAGERATVGIVKDLRAIGFEVVLLPNDMLPSPGYEAELRAAGVEIVTRESGYVHASQYVSANGHRFGAFYLIRVDVAESLLAPARKAAPAARVIFHCPDVHFVRELREAELLQDEAARERALMMRDREFAMMRQAHEVVVVSPAEAPLLAAALPGTPVSVFPVLYAPVAEAPKGFADRRHVFFLGGFGHPPNVDAVEWFAKDVWPRVRVALPDVEFHIVGAEAPEAVTRLDRLPGVKVIGFVPDLDPVLETMRVGIAPLRYGAGIKGKVAVTMGAGIPCVCTSIAAEGMGIDHGLHALLADDPLAFADAIVKLYNDEILWQRIVTNGQSLVRDRFGPAANRASLLRVLDKARALPLPLFSEYCHALAPEAVPAPASDAPVDVSIIVPAYNKWPLTLACINSVLQTSRESGVRYEIILADDGSTDETIDAAQAFPGLRVARTPANLGFLRNCNHAATRARGRHVLLLNNDTVVLPGWLEALYRTIEADESAAIVGSKLLFADGHIQEAGGGLLADGDGISIGREVIRDDEHLPVSRYEPVFNLERETDYISGASILVRQSFWQSVGGFDERYGNAYCEDSDLAMTARARGMRVIYQPRSEVVHLEHQSYADCGAAPRARMEQNRQVLLAKWGGVLRRDHLPPSPWHLVAAHGERTASPATLARRRTGRLNVLYFSPFPSHPSNHGNQATIQQFARRFQSLGHKVHFALLQSRMYTQEDVKAMRNAWDTFDILPNNHLLHADGSPIPFDGWYEEGIGECVRVLCARYDIDLVFCSYVFQSKLLEFVPAHVLRVIDTHDKMGDRYEMLRRNGQPLEFFSCTPEEEGRYLRRADVVVARREEEALYFDSVSGRDTAIVIPHVEDPHFVDKAFNSLSHVGIVASANRINLAIVRECLDAIDRRLGGRSCPFTVHVAGQVKDMVPGLPAAQADVFRKPWVRLHGFVQDIGAFYADMDLVISPVTMGTGINVKTVQAMAFGMPLLTTAWGSKGIETDEPLHAHADLDALADSLIRLADASGELPRLANVSRERYGRFLADSQKGIDELFRHPRLLVNAEFLPVAMRGAADRVPQQTRARRQHLEQVFQKRLGAQPVAYIDAKCCICGPVRLAYSRENGWEDAATGEWVVNWRENLVCPRCGLKNRWRTVVDLLQRDLRIGPSAKVYITEQTTRLYAVLRARMFPALVGSEFLGSACPPGCSHNGVRNEDLTRLSFSEESLDAILSFDVLEHIPDYERALAEVFRCLAAGGYLVLSVPFDADSATTARRAEVADDGEIRHLLPPEYHGDPINPDKGVLCFHSFGWDLLDRMREAGFTDVRAMDCWSRDMGYLGNSVLLLARKGN